MRIPVEELSTRVRSAVVADDLVKMVFSGRTRNAKPASPRVDLRPVLISGAKHIQHVRSIDGKHVSANVSLDDAATLIDDLLEAGYANVTVTSTSRVIEFRLAKGGDVFFHSTERETSQNLAHDRTKRRLLDPADPLLVAVGVSTPAGQVKAQWADKYRQVEDFVRIASVTLDRAIEAGQIPTPSTDSPLQVVDLGCGHAYLTFGLQAWLERVKGWPAVIVGVDVKADSMERNRRLAEQVGVSNMEFVAASISDFSPASGADVVLALHACDTATDDALAWAVRHRAPVILSVPCCHHDIQAQMQAGAPSPYGLVTKHGILQERLGDIITDAVRAALLREQGYRVDVIEFVSMEHTPRNVMIRAVRTGTGLDDRDRADLRQMIADWRLRPVLARLLDE